MRGRGVALFVAEGSARVTLTAMYKIFPDLQTAARKVDQWLGLYTSFFCFGVSVFFSETFFLACMVILHNYSRLVVGVWVVELSSGTCE